jgi:hypothetical protein
MLCYIIIEMKTIEKVVLNLVPIDDDFNTFLIS